MTHRLVALAQRIDTIDLGRCTNDELKQLSEETAAGVGALEGFLVRIATAAAALESAGSGSPAVDVIRSGGLVSKRRSEQIERRARIGQLLPAVGADLSAGSSRPENADSIARRTLSLSDGERRRLATQDDEISERARNLPPELFDRYFTEVVHRIKDTDDEVSLAERQRQASRFTMTRRSDGMWKLRGLLDDERGAVLDDLVRAKARTITGDRVTTDRARATALYDLAAGSGGGEPARMGIGYIVDAETLVHGPHEASVAQRWAGDPIGPSSAGRLACDADCYAVLVDELGVPGPVGRTRRSATREQRLALRALYPACPLDGTPFDRCEIHHVNVPWESGGETELDNLLPLSVPWHHRIHDRGWTLKMAGDRTLRLWRPDGTLERAIPPPVPITRRHSGNVVTDDRAQPG